MRASTSTFIAWFIAGIVSLWAMSASASPPDSGRGPRGSGKIMVAPASGRGSVLLAPGRGGYVGDLVITNLGSDPLTVSRISIRGDEEDVRAPPRVSVRFDAGATSATIAPGASKIATIAWMPDRDPRMKQALGHVIMTSTDEQAGEVAIGFTGQIEAPLAPITSHVLSWMLFLPIVGMLFAFAMHLAREDRAMRWVALVVTALECALALWACRSFVPDVTRMDGNDGFQLIERMVWLRGIGAEYFVGVDGASVSMVALTALISFAGALASFRIGRHTNGYFAMYLLVVAAMIGVFVALDLFLFIVFWLLMLVPLYFLIAGWGSAGSARGAMKLLLFALLGAALVFMAVLALHGASSPTFLVDGARAAHTFAIPELMREGFAAKAATIAGVPFVKVVWVALFVGFAMTLPMFPLHTWLPDAYAAAPPAVAALVVGVVVNAASYALLRTCVAILPEATRWAAGGIVALGVVNVVYGALCAMAQRDLARLAAYTTMSQMGFCLIGLGSLTPQGIAGCLVHMFANGAIAGMLALLIGALYERAGTRDLGALGGLARDMPGFSLAIGLALVASLGLPGLSGFWGSALALLGGFALHPVLSTLAALGLVLNAAYLLWALQRMLFGARQGAKLSDLDAREMAAIAPLVVLTIVLGVWPVPLFALVSGSVRDMAALVSPAGSEPIAMARRDF